MECSTVAERLEPTVREADEAFDRAWLASLEADIIPHLGKPRISASILEYVARILHEGSRLHEFESPTLAAEDSLDQSASKPDRMDRGERRTYEYPTTHGGTLMPREEFSYWCLDLLFGICSSSASSKIFTPYLC
jgi:hypothetical protein